MQSFFAVRVLSLSILVIPACARPLLEPDDLAEDAEVADDASVSEPPPEDAGSNPRDAQQPQDSGQPCSDHDEDGVCDSADNCPEQSNPGQSDGDDDGLGDACDAAEPVTCEGAEAIPASVSAGDATLSNVRVNGAGGVVNVAKGASLQVALSFSFSECSLPGMLRHLNVGFDGTGRCFSLPAYTCPLSGDGNTTIELIAPSMPGLHYVQARGVQSFTCSDSGSGNVRIAAICVQ